MAKVVGDIAVTVGADIAPLQRGMDRAGRSLSGFGASADRISARIVTTMAKVGVAVAAVGTAYVGLAAKSASVGVEIANLSRIAGVSTTEFQKMAVAARTVGISQEKLADILKDVNDRVGDFMATGGGPMKDFFENVAPLVGVTADNFARLSGPEALQLYITSLQKAGASQQDMTFYLEAMASDATALVPLLRDNGREMQRLGDEAERTGRIMDSDTIQAAREMETKLTAIRDTIRNELLSALISTEDELLILAQFVNDYAIPALKELIGGASKAAEWFESLAGWISAAAAASKELGGDPIFMDSAGNRFDQNGNLIPTGASGSGSAGSGGGRRGSAKPSPKADTPLPPGTLRPTYGGGGGGGKGRDYREEFAALQERFATEAEIIQLEYEKQLAMLDEFRAQKVAKEAEYNELEQRINKEHQDKMRSMEQAAQAARLDAVSGALGDLSALMSSNNKKMFAIGKAAAIAEATVSGYQAAVKAWNYGMGHGGPAAATAFTAASLAKTGALIGSIASQSANGGGSQANPGGGTPAVPQVSRQIAIQLNGDTFSGASVRNLINQINQEVENGARIRVV